MGSLEDRRGSMGSIEEQKPTTEGVNGTKEGVNGDAMEVPSTSGPGTASDTKKMGQGDDAKPDEPKDSTSGNGTLAPAEATNTDAVNPDKPAMAVEEDTPPMQPSDPKDEEAVSGGAALAPKGESLGTLLKGSEFEPVENNESTEESSKKPNTEGNPSTPKKTKTSEKPTPGQHKAPSTPKMNGSPRTKPGSVRPSPLKKPEEPSAAKPGEQPAAENQNASDASQTPTSPTATKTDDRQPDQTAASSKSSPKISPKTSPKTSPKSSPKQAPQPKSAPQPAEDDRKKTTTTRKTPRPSTGAKPAPLATSKTAKPTSSAANNGAPKAPKVTSPNTAKPRPRSPTRPVRLPGAATASTAASAAKTGSSAPPQPSARTSLSGLTKPLTSNKPTDPKNPPKAAQPVAPGPRTKAPRSSLPASTAGQKPKPRTSIASTKAAGGDFLSRMMRPTQSSASKTHEKVEQKTPPKKRVSSRPKGTSDESDKQANSQPAQADPATEQGSPVQDDAASEGQGHVQGNGESNHVDPEAEMTDVPQRDNKASSEEEAAEPSTGEAVPQATAPVFGP